MVQTQSTFAIYTIYSLQSVSMAYLLFVGLNYPIISL